MKNLKILKGYSETVNQRPQNTSQVKKRTIKTNNDLQNTIQKINDSTTRI
jgi:hypothetical protein